jgi:hypothetical protein
MIGYYISCGDTEVCDVFTPYVGMEKGISTQIDAVLKKENYGNDMQLLLIQYYVEGRFSNYLPSQPKLGNYVKKNKDIAVAIGVTREQFHSRNEFERREFIVDSTLSAIKLVKERLLKKKLDIDFNRLIDDVQEITVEYLKFPVPYAPQ